MDASIKTRGVLGKLALEDARWAAKVIDPKRGVSKVLKKFTLSQILSPGDIVKVRIKSMQKNKVQLVLDQEPDVEGALVTIDQHTGFVRALIGSYDYIKSDYNRALYAKRQPGSAFKPIIYAAALDHGYTPASIILDEPITFKGGEPRKSKRVRLFWARDLKLRKGKQNFLFL